MACSWALLTVCRTAMASATASAIDCRSAWFDDVAEAVEQRAGALDGGDDLGVRWSARERRCRRDQNPLRGGLLRDRVAG